MTRRISDDGLAMVKRLEGLRLDAYLDTGGVWTIGYGHTGRDVHKGLVCDGAQAEAWLRDDLADAERAVADHVTVALNDNQHAALVSFVFNVGEGLFMRSTLLRLLNAGRYQDVPAQLVRWRYDNGKVIEGLANRRAAECGMWARGAFAASASVKPKLLSIATESP